MSILHPAILRRLSYPIILAAVCVSVHAPGVAQVKLLDDFSDVSGWKSIVSDGAKLSLSHGEGKTGSALVMEFDLTGVFGYVIAEKAFPLDLPANYEFTFDLRGETPVNNFEFKLMDDSSNVFWIKRLNVDYPKNWTLQRIRKRQITFAWGPSRGGEIRKVKSIQFAVSCGTGGKGRVFIDNFRLVPIEQSPGTPLPAEIIGANSGMTGTASINAAGSQLTGWRTDAGNSPLEVDFHRSREVGGLIIDWDSLDYATGYDILLSDDNRGWAPAYSVEKGVGGRSYLYMQDAGARYLKIQVTSTSRGKGYAIRRLAFEGSSFSNSPNDLYRAIASDAPVGFYPKYFRDRQSYWTVTGVSGDSKKALVNEEGQVEVDKGAFSIEPFIYVGGRLVTWNSVRTDQYLLYNYIPFPAVTWTSNDGWLLRIQAVTGGVPGNSLLVLHYNLEAQRDIGKGKIFVAIRPFQVNPPWQALNGVGGCSRIDSISYTDGFVNVNGMKVVPMTIPSAFGAAEFDQGDITKYLSAGTVPGGNEVRDHFGHASAALEYDFDLRAGEIADVVVGYSFHGWNRSPVPNMSPGSPQLYQKMMASTVGGRWQRDLNRVRFNFPPRAADVANTLRSELGYILINRNGNAIEPGPRNYDRSWIRDGALTSAALLRTGYPDEVRAFIDWYAKGQYANGKIPCVIDSRGPDATPEYDSNGEFIYAVLQYFLFTKDTLWLRGKFDAVVNAVRYIQSLRSERKTDTYKNGSADEQILYGLLPQSISHEGYSDVPRHSYWDDFFALRGLKDAASIAGILGDREREREFGEERDDLRKDLYASMRGAMKLRGVDYIPGCAELGDFDATSTAIGISPCGELGNIPEPALQNTFDKYYRFFKDRAERKNYVNYTPYETRIIGAFVRLGEKKRAEEALNFFMKDRRPPEWNAWGEVVWRNPDTAGYVGDIPHTWVGSDFVRSVLSMFAYERERDTALVVASGIPDAWVSDTTGINVEGLRTYDGILNLSLHPKGKRVIVELSGTIDPAVSKIVLVSPLSGKVRGVKVDGSTRRMTPAGEVRVTRLPAKIEFTYQ